MNILNWYNELMGNNLVLVTGMIFSFAAMHFWGKFEEKWKRENNFSISKKIIKGIGILLIGIFGLPGIYLFFGTKF